VEEERWKQDEILSRLEIFVRDLIMFGIYALPFDDCTIHHRPASQDFERAESGCTHHIPTIIDNPLFSALDLTNDSNPKILCQFCAMQVLAT
jgi:hypothetical protein